jgi:hypothetical protein
MLWSGVNRTRTIARQQPTYGRHSASEEFLWPELSVHASRRGRVRREESVVNRESTVSRRTESAVNSLQWHCCQQVLSNHWWIHKTSSVLLILLINRMYKSKRLLYLFVVTRYKRSIILGL